MWILLSICSFYSFCPRDVWINWRRILCLTLFVWAVIFTHTWGQEACSLALMAHALRAKHEANVESQTEQQRAPCLGRSDALQNKSLSAFWSLISTWTHLFLFSYRFQMSFFFNFWNFHIIIWKYSTRLNKCVTPNLMVIHPKGKLQSLFNLISVYCTFVNFVCLEVTRLLTWNSVICWSP